MRLKKCSKEKNNTIPPINKKLIKNVNLSVILNILVTILFLVVVVINIMNIFPQFSARINIIDSASVFVALYALVWQISEAMKSKRILIKLAMDIEMDDKYINVSCSLSNVGTVSIYPYMVNLYIDKGIYNHASNVYEFDGYLNHRTDEDNDEVFDCKLAEHCKKEKSTSGKITFPGCVEKKFKSSHVFCHNIRPLSHFTLVHVMPGETFNENIVLNLLPPGVYRATMIYTGKNYDDCICYTKKLIVK